MAHSSVAHEAEHEPGRESGRAADAVPAQGRCDPPQSKGVVVSVDAAVCEGWSGGGRVYGGGGRARPGRAGAERTSCSCI